MKATATLPSSRFDVKCTSVMRGTASQTKTLQEASVKNVSAQMSDEPLAKCSVCKKEPGFDCRAHFVKRIRELEAERDSLYAACDRMLETIHGLHAQLLVEQSK